MIEKLKNWKNLSRSKKAVILAIATFVGFFLWGLKADAAEVRLGLGAGYANIEGAIYQEVMVIDSRRKWYGSLTRIGNDNRNNYTFTRGCAGYRVNWRRDTNFSPFMRLGACAFDKEPTDYISDPVAFDMAIGFRLYDIVELEIDQHNSTAGRSEQNAGMDAVMLGIIFPFGSK